MQLPRKGPSSLLKAVEALYPELPDARASIEEGKIAIDGRIVRNPASMVGAGSCVTVVAAVRLRGEAKLQAALDRFDVPVAGRIALDAGAAAGGFTRVLLDRGAVRVYAVDAGHGQLAGFLRQHPRVVNLERTNLAVLGPGIVPDRIDLITLDLSYLSLTDAVPQLDRLSIGPHADLVALVKPMFELHLSQPPPAAERAALERALATAVEGIGRAGWQVVASMESPVLGSRGAFEFLVHAHRSQASGAGGPE